MRSSLRNRLLFTFLILVVVTGAGTLFWIEHTLADDLLTSLDSRLTSQGRSVATWVSGADHPTRLATRLSEVTGSRITIVGSDGLIQGDSVDPDAVGRPIGDAYEVSQARRGEVGRTIRRLDPDDPLQYLVALPAEYGRVVRLSVPLGDVLDTRARMRNRLLVGAGFGFLGCLFLSWIFIRAIIKPLQSMTRTAEQLAAGRYEVPPPTDAGGELGVLARAMMHMVGEVNSRVSELTEQRDLLSTVFSGLVEGVVVVDETGAVVLANQIAKPLVGEGGLPASLVELVERALAGEQADAELELVGRTVRASARPLLGHVAEKISLSKPPTAAASGPIAARTGAIVVLYDVTRMRALEAVRREFLSNAAHELRTPVTSISGYAETLLGGGVDPETSKEFLQTIHRNSQRISSLVSDLLVLDTLGGRATILGERRAVSLGEVVQDAARTAKGVTPGAQIDNDVPVDLAVLGTREGLDHVVQNLIDNAVKYGGGTKVTVRSERANGHVRLTVADRGAGIPKGQEDRIFERFYRLDYGRSRNEGGSGLGLAIVKSQIDAMGGRVWVENNQPGARFVVELDAI